MKTGEHQRLSDPHAVAIDADDYAEGLMRLPIDAGIYRARLPGSPVREIVVADGVTKDLALWVWNHLGPDTELVVYPGRCTDELLIDVPVAPASTPDAVTPVPERLGGWEGGDKVSRPAAPTPAGKVHTRRSVSSSLRSGWKLDLELFERHEPHRDFRRLHRLRGWSHEISQALPT